MKLLTFLVRKKTEMYEREISRSSGLSIGAVNQGLGELLREEILTRKKKGRMYFYTVNHELPLVKHFKVFLTIFELSSLIRKVRGQCDRIVLYGSCAFGEDFEDSDVDILILSREKDFVKKEVEAFAKQFPRKISSTIINSSEWLSLKKQDKAFYNEVNKGIELWRGSL
jgi:predicted nucleotidyltransferase